MFYIAGSSFSAICGNTRPLLQIKSGQFRDIILSSAGRSGFVASPYHLHAISKASPYQVRIKSV